MEINGLKLGLGASYEVNLEPLLCDGDLLQNALKILALAGVNITALDVNRQYRLRLKLEDAGPRMYTSTTYYPSSTQTWDLLPTTIS